MFTFGAPADSSREQTMGGRGREKHVVIVKGETRGILVSNKGVQKPV